VQHVIIVYIGALHLFVDEYFLFFVCVTNIFLFVYRFLFMT